MDDVGGGRSRPALTSGAEVDVVILGAGFTGLWTAYALQELDPALRIGIVEAEHVGFGASGRNGGWCTAGISVSWSELVRRYGRDAAVGTARALQAAVDGVSRDSADAGVDAHFRKGGILRIARGPHEVAAMRSAWDVRVAIGLDEGCELLSAEALTERVAVAGAEGAVFDGHGATVHPGRLVTGLAAAVEARGATIWEGTRVTGVREAGQRRGGRSGRTPSGRGGVAGGPAGGRPALETSAGDVLADVVVLAGEAFLADLPGHHRDVLPVYSLIVLTDPLTHAQRTSVGWERGECLSSHRHTVDYLARTDDGRILFGGRGAPYHYGSGIAPAHDQHGPTHDNLRAQLLDWFPTLEGIGFTAQWGGAVGLSRNWLPAIRHDRDSGIAAAHGYGGQGVATAHLAGRVLAHRITGTPMPDIDPAVLAMLDHTPRRWEPEPLRWLAVRYLQGALARLDAKAAATGRPPTGRSLAERLTRH